MSETNPPPPLRLHDPNRRPPEVPDPLDGVPPPPVIRRRLAELVEATTFTRRLLRLSEKMHRRPGGEPRPQAHANGEGGRQ